MPLLERRTDPTPKELRWFGLVVWPMFVVVATLLYFQSHRPVAAGVVFGLSTLALVLYYSLPPLRKAAFVTWMKLFHPLGWVMSHLLLGVVYFLVLTPIGGLIRLLRRDSLARRLDPEAESYWISREGKVEASRYFRQF